MDIQTCATNFGEEWSKYRPSLIVKVLLHKVADQRGPKECHNIGTRTSTKRLTRKALDALNVQQKYSMEQQLMYAVIKTGGKQYRVSAGDKLKVESLDAAEGQDIQITEVLMIGNGDDVTIGSPMISNASVTASPLSPNPFSCRRGNVHNGP